MALTRLSVISALAVALLSACAVVPQWPGPQADAAQAELLAEARSWMSRAPPTANPRSGGNG